MNIASQYATATYITLDIEDITDALQGGRGTEISPQHVSGIVSAVLDTV